MSNSTIQDNCFKALHIIPTTVVCSVLAVVIVVCIAGCVTTNDNLYESVRKGNTQTMVLTSRKTGNNLYRRVKDWKMRWIYRPVHFQSSNNSISQEESDSPVHPQPSNNSISQEELDRLFQPQDEQKVRDFQAEDKHIEDANRRLEHELRLIRNKSN